MCDTVSTGRSTATGGRRTLLLLTLLALLCTALIAGGPAAPPPDARGCAGRTTAALLPGTADLVPGAADRSCTTASQVLAPSQDGARHPGNGFRRMRHASACHLRHQVPTGPGGKAVRQSAGTDSLTTPGHAGSRSVLPAAAAGPSSRVTVLRC
ncbi:hypothetical protein GCM10010211_43120 [Streptomyces albospinus]|uniref:Secreted protein n=1 Tax=Streptomyces albospinus TaxID=285515 RepID=A0ABQ2V8P7_9ACTN|nr:hypothetical protein [Streptomyces albospinus]GGU72661.1 hypothetical protein GCM10010211_43120 [Streptomyces albospinus]